MFYEDFDAEECVSIQTIAALKRLRSLGWKEQEVRDVEDEVVEEMKTAWKVTLAETLRDLARSARVVSDVDIDAKILTLANFALCGVEIADRAHRRRVAACN